MLEQQTDHFRKLIDIEMARKTYPDEAPSVLELPAARYADTRFAELENTRLWNRIWLLAGHVSELPEKGSYKLFTKLDRSVIVTRGADGNIRAFHNMCRHRASAIILDEAGRVPRFMCPYHAWTYALDGRLLALPEAHNFNCLDKEAMSLLPVRCETWNGLIYLNFDDAASPLAEYLKPIEPHIGSFPLHKAVLKDRILIDMDCNWKAAYDNFLEIYHVNVVHANSIAPYVNSKSFVISLLPKGHARMTTQRQLGNTIFGVALPSPDEAVAHLREHTIALPTFPNGFVALDAAAFVWQTFWPNGVGKSVMEAHIFGWADYDDVDPKFWADMRAQTMKILSEDLALFGGIQASMESGLQRSVRLSWQERVIYWYHQEIDRIIGADHIPASMAVTPLLSGE